MRLFLFRARLKNFYIPGGAPFKDGSTGATTRRWLLNQYDKKIEGGTGDVSFS
jgi:hypothetical protein